MPSPSLTHLLAVTVALVATGCGADGPDAASRLDVAAPPTSSSSVAAVPDATASAADGSAVAGLARPTLAPAVVAGFDAAVEAMWPAFTTFARDYGHAFRAKDARGIVTCALRLRAAVVAFDEAVRALDLAPLQRSVDRLLLLHEELVSTLDDVAASDSRAAAVRIVDRLPFQDFRTAFTDLQASLQALS